MSKNITEEYERLLNLINETIPKKKCALTLNTSEVATLMGVSSSSIEKWRKDCKGLDYIEANGRVLYRKDKVIEFLICNQIKSV